MRYNEAALLLLSIWVVLCSIPPFRPAYVPKPDQGGSSAIPHSAVRWIPPYHDVSFSSGIRIALGELHITDELLRPSSMPAIFLGKYIYCAPVFSVDQSCPDRVFPLQMPQIDPRCQKKLLANADAKPTNWGGDALLLMRLYIPARSLARIRAVHHPR